MDESVGKVFGRTDVKVQRKAFLMGKKCTDVMSQRGNDRMDRVREGTQARRRENIEASDIRISHFCLTDLCNSFTIAFIPVASSNKPAVSHFSYHHHASLLLFAFASLPFPILSNMFSRSLSNFNFVIMTLLGAIPSGTL